MDKNLNINDILKNVQIEEKLVTDQAVFVSTTSAASRTAIHIIISTSCSCHCSTSIELTDC